ncbi:MAG: hypothetical protein ABEL76_04830, partial [Bradymonadaceae bacterium]
EAPPTNQFAPECSSFDGREPTELARSPVRSARPQAANKQTPTSATVSLHLRIELVSCFGVRCSDRLQKIGATVDELDKAVNSPAQRALLPQLPTPGNRIGRNEIARIADHRHGGGRLSTRLRLREGSDVTD